MASSLLRTDAESDAYGDLLSPCANDGGDTPAAGGSAVAQLAPPATAPAPPAAAAGSAAASIVPCGWLPGRKDGCTTGASV